MTELNIDKDLLVPQIIFADETAFRDWVVDLEVSAAIVVARTLEALSRMDHATDLGRNWVKDIHSGVKELRLGKTVAQVIKRLARDARDPQIEETRHLLLRIFYSEITQESMLVLNAYDKFQHPSRAFQKEEILKAIHLLETWRLRNDVL